MSDYEDDLDEDLPLVSLSQSISEKSELEMPPASEVASQRAREEAAERALQDFHDTASRFMSLSRSASQGSSGEEGEAALSAAVSALQVEDALSNGRDLRAERVQLMAAMRDHLPADDAQFLDAYIQVLKDRPEAMDAVTEKILQTISAELINGWGSTGVCGVCAWLLCVSLSSTKALRARRALHALLDAHVESEHVEVVERACVALQGAEQLVRAHDAVRSGARRGADRAAAVALARATAAVLPHDHEEMKPVDAEPPPPLSAESITSVRSSWRTMSPSSQLTLLRCAGRALAARGWRQDGEQGEEGEETEASGEEGGAALLAALAQPLPRASLFQMYRHQVLKNVSNLQLLFRTRCTSVPEPSDDNLDNSQGSISELTDTQETRMTEETVPSLETPIQVETPMTDDTLPTVETSMTEETLSTVETPMTEETSMAQETSMTEETPMIEETSMAEEKSTTAETPMAEEISTIDEKLCIEETSTTVDTEISPHRSTGEFTKTPIVGKTMTQETSTKEPAVAAKAPLKKDTNTKSKTQTKLDRFMTIGTPTKMETKTKQTEEYERSPERKRPRRERRERACRKGRPM